MVSKLKDIILPDYYPQFPIEWGITTLKNLIEDNRKISYGIVQPGSPCENGIPIIRVNNLQNGYINTTEILKVDKKIEDKYLKTRLNGGEVLLSLVGTMGRSAIVPHLMKGYNIARALAMIPVAKEIEAEWVNLCLQTGFSQSFIRKHATTTVQATFNLRDVKNIIIPLPGSGERNAIISVLKCINDKIQLNNKINKTLEEMAQAIFKSWFVDFEPFRDGEFADSELGEVPKGWKVGTLSDLGKIVGGSTPSKSRAEYYTDQGIAWITPKYLSNNKDKFISSGDIDITELGLKNSSAKIMPKDTVLFSSRAPIGYIAIAKNEVTTNQGFKSVVPKKNIGTAYVYFYLKNNLTLIESRASGSTFKEVSASIMKQVPALIPDDEVLKRFQNISNVYFEQQMNLESENHTLIAIRDTLLPKLMSGQIRVPIEEV